MGLRVEKLRLVLEMQAKDLTRGVTKSIVDLKKLDVATAKAANGVTKSFNQVEQGAEKGSKAHTKAADAAERAAKKTEAAVAKTAAAAERAAKKTADAAARAAVATEKASKRAAAAAERAATRTAAAAAKAARETARFNKKVAATQAALAASAAKVNTTVPAAFATLERRVGVASKKLRASLNGARIAIAAFGAGAIIAAPVKFAASFKKTLANVDTLLVDSAVSIKRYEEQLLKLSVTTSKELIDLTQGLYQTISAGIPAVEGAGGAFEVLERATKAAEAGLATTEQAVDAFTTVINAYSDSGLTAAEISDKLFTTIRIGKTTFPELASSIGRVATVASKFNVDIDEMLAALAELTKNGLSSDEAVTQLRATILGLARPADKVRESLGEMGIEIGAAAFESKGLVGVLREIGEATGDDADEIAKLLPNVRALVGGLVLGSDGAKGFQTSLEALQNSTGATDAAFEKISKTFTQTFAIFKSQVQSTLVVVGNKILPEVQDAFKRFGDAIVEDQEKIVEGFKAFADALFAIGKFIVRFGPTIIKFMVTFFAVNRIVKATKALAGFGQTLSLIIKKSAAGRTAAQTFTKGFTSGVGRLPGIIGGILKSPNLIALIAGAGFLIGEVLIDSISDAVTAGERKIQATLEAQLKETVKRADEAARALGFSDFGARSAQAESRTQGDLIQIGPNRSGRDVRAEELVTPSAAFQQILVDVEGNIGAAADFLAEEIAEETGRLAGLRDRALAVAKREFNEVERLRGIFASIKNANGSFATKIQGELDNANRILFEQEALAKDIAGRISKLESAPGALAQAEKDRIAAKSAEKDARDSSERRSKNAAAFTAKLRASEAARRSLLKGSAELRLKDAASAAKFEQALAERVLKEQESAAQESLNIAKASGASDDELLELQESNAETRIGLINAVEEAQKGAFDASLALQKQTDDARVASIEKLGKKALLSARGAADKVLEIEAATQAKIGSVLDRTAIKRQQLAARRVEQAKATGEAIIAIEANLAAARRGDGQRGAGAPGLTSGGVADAAGDLLGNIDTFLAGELNKAQRDSAREAAKAAADAGDQAAAASARFRSTGADSDKRSALAAVGAFREASGAASESALVAGAGAGVLAGASGIIGIALAVDKAVDLIGSIGSFLETGLTDFGSKIGANFEQLADGLEAFPDQMSILLSEQLPEFIDRFFERLPEVLQTVVPALVRAWPDLIAALTAAAPQIGFGLAEAFLDVSFWTDMFVGVAEAAVDSIKNFFSNEFISDLASLLSELIKDLGREIADTVTGGGIFDGLASGEGFLGAVGEFTGVSAATKIARGDFEDLSLADIPVVGGVADFADYLNPFHSGGSVNSGSSPNAAAFMSAAGAPGFQGGGLVEAMGASLRGAFGTAFKDDVPATLQTGEFVLSRQAVAALGGARGAEAVNRGGSPGGATVVTISPSPGGMDALLRSIIASVTVEAATPGTGLRNAVVGADPFLGSQFVRGRKA